MGTASNLIDDINKDNAANLQLQIEYSEHFLKMRAHPLRMHTDTHNQSKDKHICDLHVYTHMCTHIHTYTHTHTYTKTHCVLSLNKNL